MIRAAGAVLWRPSRRDGLKIALVHRPRYDDWSLPKGKAEHGEVVQVTAAREVQEETGFRAAIGRSLTTVSYTTSAGPKTVQYFAARITTGCSLGTSHRAPQEQVLDVDTGAVGR